MTSLVILIRKLRRFVCLKQSFVRYYALRCVVSLGWRSDLFLSIWAWIYILPPKAGTKLLRPRRASLPRKMLSLVVRGFFMKTHHDPLQLVSFMPYSHDLIDREYFKAYLRRTMLSCSYRDRHSLAHIYVKKLMTHQAQAHLESHSEVIFTAGPLTPLTPTETNIYLRPIGMRAWRP